MIPHSTFSPGDASDLEIVSTRRFDASQEALFDAFGNPDHLVQWWGPNGFTNTIKEFDLRPGGTLLIVLHGPNGNDFENRKVFSEVVRPQRIVFQHMQPMHHFTMTMTFEADSGSTKLIWRMRFDSAEECAKLRDFITDANEQNLDRLEIFLKTIER